MSALACPRCGQLNHSADAECGGCRCLLRPLLHRRRPPPALTELATVTDVERDEPPAAAAAAPPRGGTAVDAPSAGDDLRPPSRARDAHVLAPRRSNAAAPRRATTPVVVDDAPGECDGAWSCRACTLVNVAAATACAACGQRVFEATAADGVLKLRAQRYSAATAAAAPPTAALRGANAPGDVQHDTAWMHKLARLLERRMRTRRSRHSPRSVFSPLPPHPLLPPIIRTFYVNYISQLICPDEAGANPPGTAVHFNGLPFSDFQPRPIDRRVVDGTAGGGDVRYLLPLAGGGDGLHVVVTEGVRETLWSAYTWDSDDSLLRAFIDECAGATPLAGGAAAAARDSIAGVPLAAPDEPQLTTVCVDARDMPPALRAHAVPHRVGVEYLYPPIGEQVPYWGDTPLDAKFGCMHVKLVVIKFVARRVVLAPPPPAGAAPDGAPPPRRLRVLSDGTVRLRVAVTSANLSDWDYHAMDQCLYVQDFFPRPENDAIDAAAVAAWLWSRAPHVAGQGSRQAAPALAPAPAITLSADEAVPDAAEAHFDDDERGAAGDAPPPPPPPPSSPPTYVTLYVSPVLGDFEAVLRDTLRSFGVRRSRVVALVGGIDFSTATVDLLLSRPGDHGRNRTATAEDVERHRAKIAAAERGGGRAGADGVDAGRDTPSAAGGDGDGDGGAARRAGKRERDADCARPAVAADACYSSLYETTTTTLPYGADGAERRVVIALRAAVGAYAHNDDVWPDVAKRGVAGFAPSDCPFTAYGIMRLTVLRAFHNAALVAATNAASAAAVASVTGAARASTLAWHAFLSGGSASSVSRGTVPLQASRLLAHEAGAVGCDLQLQCSSVGRLSESWLRKLYAAGNGLAVSDCEDAGERMKQLAKGGTGDAPLRIVFPSDEAVSSSAAGVKGASHLLLDERERDACSWAFCEHMPNTALAPGRTRVLAHSKVFTPVYQRLPGAVAPPAAAAPLAEAAASCVPQERDDGAAGGSAHGAVSDGSGGGSGGGGRDGPATSEFVPRQLGINGSAALVRDWVLVGSHNASVAAWGMHCKAGKPHEWLRILSYELGAVFPPVLRLELPMTPAMVAAAAAVGSVAAVPGEPDLAPAFDAALVHAYPWLAAFRMRWATPPPVFPLLFANPAPRYAAGTKAHTVDRAPRGVAPSEQ